MRSTCRYLANRGQNHEPLIGGMNRPEKCPGVQQWGAFVRFVKSVTRRKRSR